ncbi:hypothetical protein ZIOFF_017980 [Zingiber officinale]|uniref:Mitochondrial carrier protein n=2 Tax=Zingiber officinale TaxID=94328 RepID=A0A8J5HCF2_ZINOF|nr:hypothetical protein ZIOFF_017980 [Zingiber officinale]
MHRSCPPSNPNSISPDPDKLWIRLRPFSFSDPRHGGKAVAIGSGPELEPPPPGEAEMRATESEVGEKEEAELAKLHLPAEIDWHMLDKSRFFVLGAALFSAVSAALYPAVVLKTRLQVCHPAPPSAWSAGVDILRREGPASFYRGYCTSLAGTVPARTLYMGALEITKSAVGTVTVRFGVSEPTASTVASAAAGLSAAVAAQVVWTPIDVVSQRLMVQGRHVSTSKYLGGIDAFRKIVAGEGIRGLYRGFGMSILTYAPSNAVWWASYSVSQKLVWSGIGYYLCRLRLGVEEQEFGSSSTGAFKPESRTVVVVQGLSAALAGGAAALLTMPLDTIKTRLQVMEAGEGPITIRQTLRNLIKEGGWSACYRGLGPRWASMSMSATTMITTYEFLKRLSAKKQED